MTTTTTPLPCRETMLRFMRALTDGAQGGNIELAYNKHADGDPAWANQYPIADIDTFCDHAVSLNTEPTNIYYSPALRRLDCPQGRRTGKAHVFGSQWVWADFDSDADAAKERCRALGLMPSIAVVTGMYPEKRTQMLWRVPFTTDLAAIEAQQRALRIALNGDPAVVDYSRVLRLPGAVAWPTAKKKDRVPERVGLFFP